MNALIQTLDRKPMVASRRGFMSHTGKLSAVAVALLANGALVGHDLKTRKAIWSTNLGHVPGSLSRNRLLCRDEVALTFKKEGGGRSVVAIDVKAGQTRWSQALGSPMFDATAASDGQVVVFAVGGHWGDTDKDVEVRGVELGTGKALWRVGIDGAPGPITARAGV